MWCRVLLGVIAISYLLCVLVLSFMQKEDLDVGLLKKVQRRNADENQLKIEYVQKECFLKINPNTKAPNEPTEGDVVNTTTSSVDQLEKQNENTLNKLRSALGKFDLAAILECMKHVQVTITEPSSTTMESTTSAPIELTTVITKDYSSTNKVQYDLNAEKKLENVLEALETNTDVPATVAATESNKEKWNVTTRNKKQRSVTLPSVIKKKIKRKRSKTVNIEDVDSKEIERMTKILNAFKNRRRNLPIKATTEIKITTKKPTTTKHIIVESQEDGRLSKIFAEYENGQNYLGKTTTSTEPTIITDDSGEKYRLSKIFAEYENIPKSEKKIITTTADPVKVTTEPNTDTDEVKRLSIILAKFKKKQKDFLATTSIKPIVEPTTDESIEMKQLGRLIAEFEKKQERMKKTTTTSVSPTTMELTTTEPTTLLTKTTDFEEIKLLRKLLLEFNITKDNLDTTSTTLVPHTSTKKFEEIEQIKKILEEYSNIKKPTTVKPTTIEFTTTEPAEIVRLRKLLANYENGEALFTKAIITTTVQPATVKATTIDDSKNIERLRRLLVQYETQELLKKTTTSPTSTEPIIIISTTTSEYKEVQRLKELLAKYEEQERPTTKLSTTSTTEAATTTTTATTENINNSIEIERLKKLLEEYKNKQELSMIITTKAPIIKTTTIDDYREIERLKKLLNDFEISKIISRTEPIIMKPTTIIISNDIEHLSKLLAEYKTQEYIRRTNIMQTTEKPTTIMSSKEIQRLSNLLWKYESQDNSKETTVALTTIDAAKEIESLNKLIDEYRNKQSYQLQMTTSTTIKPIPTTFTTIYAAKEIERLNKLLDEYRNKQSYQLEMTTSTTIKPLPTFSLLDLPINDVTTFKSNVQLTDTRLHDMLNFWENFIKTSTPFELTSSTPKVTTTKATTKSVSIRDFWRRINWYEPLTVTEHTTKTTYNPMTTDAIEKLPEDTKEMTNFRDILKRLKNSRKMGRNDEPKAKEKKKIINKAVKRIEHYLRIIKNRQDIGSDTDLDYKDAMDIEVEDNQTIEEKKIKPYPTDNILKNRKEYFQNDLRETTTAIEKDIMGMFYEPVTTEKYRQFKYIPPEVLLQIKDTVSPSTGFVKNYRRKNYYESTTNFNFETELLGKVYKTTISHEKNKEDIKDLPPEVLKDFAKNIKEQVLNDLRKQIVTSSTTMETFPVALPSKQRDTTDEKQEATNAIVKFIKIIEQFTADKAPKPPPSPSSAKTITPDKDFPAPINIVYQHTNLIPPPKEPDLAKTCKSPQKNVINGDSESKNRKAYSASTRTDYNTATKPNDKPLVLHPFPGEIPPLQVPQLLIPETIVVNKNIVLPTSSTTQSLGLQSDTPEHYDLNFFRNNNRRDELKKIRDSLDVNSNPANIVEKIKSNDNNKPGTLDEPTKHSLNYNTINVLNQKVEEPKKEENFKKFIHNVPLHNKIDVPHTDLKFRQLARNKYHNSGPHITEIAYEESYQPINTLDIQGIKGFHERLEGMGQWPKDPNTMIDNLKEEENRASALQMTARHQMPITHSKKAFDDSPFKNFIKTQQKVNEILEEILATRAKARSTEAA